MPRTGLPASPGAKGRACLFLVALVLSPVAGRAQDYASGQAAYAARDWGAAETLWTGEAAEGSAEAILGLGNLYDFGLLGRPDPERAFGLYQEAATLGSAEAGFNVAVMQDSGVGTAQDRRAAAAWYSFAALGGHARASYNLGQLFAQGAGVAQSDALAAFWFDRAAQTLPAAAEARAALKPSQAVVTGELSPPDPLALQTFTLAEGVEARIAWQDPAAVPDASYRVDVLGMTPGGLSPLASAQTSGSAISLPLPSAGIDFAWRISRVTEDEYAASGWQTRGGEQMANPPVGAVRFEYDAADRRAEGLAYRLGGAMTRGGTLVSYKSVERPITTGDVTYGYLQDAELAKEVSSFVPGMATTGPELSPEAELAPGEIRVSLSFVAGN